MEGQLQVSRFKFSIRTLLVVTAVVSGLLYWFLSQYEFVTTTSAASVVSPDGRHTLRLETKRHKNINRSWFKVECTLLRRWPTPQVVLVAYSLPGIHYAASDVLADYDKLGFNAVNWDLDSSGCTYKITDREKGRLEFRQNSWRRIDIGP